MEASLRMESRKACGRVVVVRDLSGEEHEAAGLACRLIGGFLVDRTTLLKKAPVGIQYTSNLLKKKRLTYLEPEVYKDAAVHRVLRTAADFPGSQLVLAKSCEEVQKACDKYKEKHGIRSKPWLSMRCPFSYDQRSS